MTFNTKSKYLNVFILACFIVLISADNALAQAALFDSGTNFLQALVDLLTNTWARIIGIIAVIGVGILWMLGRLQWGVAAAVVGGLILVFGAPAIVDSVAGSL